MFIHKNEFPRFLSGAKRIGLESLSEFADLARQEFAQKVRRLGPMTLAGRIDLRVKQSPMWPERFEELDKVLLEP